MGGKMGGVWAPKPSPGPHKNRECLPMTVVLRDRLKYALTGKECMQICMERCEKAEAEYKLCRVNKVYTGANKIPLLVTHDGRTIRYPDPKIKVNDTVKVNIATGKIVDFVKFKIGVAVMLTKGRNSGRVGTLMHVEHHDNSFDIVTIKDAKGHTFSTRLQNVFIIGSEKDSLLVTLPKGRGIKKSIIEERAEAEEAGRL